MAEVGQRFFCHQCNVEIPRIAADFTCPTCNSGFIEELAAGEGPGGRAGGGGGGGGAVGLGQDDDSDGEEQYDLGQVLGPLESILPGLLGGGLGGVGQARGFPGPIRVRQGPSQRIRISRGPPQPPHRVGPQGPHNLGMDQAALENALQDFVFNLAGMQFGGAGAGGAAGGGAPGGARFHFIGPGAQLHGNPGDYAWGRGGLDAIITQLLNQMDGAGPPPMAKENIQQIPSVKITKKMMEKSESCSVCWEDFSEGEEVKLLECEHCFHEGCIVPWLELHGTCPVCRKELSKTSDSPGAGAEAGGGADPLAGDQTQGPAGPAAAGAAGAAGGPGAAGGAGGGAGLTGFIQSTLNQMFGSSGWTGPSGPSGPPSHNHTNVSSSDSSSSSNSSSNATTTSSQPQPPPRDNNGSGARSTSDEETPAARRQRLDPDFVDLDFD